MKDLEFYFAYVALIDLVVFDKIYLCGEGSISSQIKSAFTSIAGHYPAICSSGWRVTQEQTDQISFATYDEETKKDIIQSYINENKKLPRHLRAWQLLLEQENKEV